MSLIAFGRLLGDLAGRPRQFTALEHLCAIDPKLAGRLTMSILPGIVRLARQLPEAPLETHVALQATHTSMPRRIVAGWLAHLLLGTIAEPSPEHPELSCARLLASQHPWEQAKVRCLLEDFDRVAQVVPEGNLDIERVVAPAPILEHWVADTMPLADLDVETRGYGRRSPTTAPSRIPLLGRPMARPTSSSPRSTPSTTGAMTPALSTRGRPFTES